MPQKRITNVIAYSDGKDRVFNYQLEATTTYSPHARQLSRPAHAIARIRCSSTGLRHRRPADDEQMRL